MHPAVKEEALQHFRGAEPRAILGFDHLSILGDIIVNAHIGVKALFILLIIGKMGVDARLHAACIRLFFAGDDAQKGGFATAIGSYDSDAFPRLEVVVYILEQQVGTIAFGEFAQL